MDYGVSYREVTRNKGFIIFMWFRIAHHVLMKAFPELPPLPTMILYAPARGESYLDYDYGLGCDKLSQTHM